MADPEGASANERLLAAARSDNEELIVEILDGEGFNINCKDGSGNTPLHNAVSHGSTDVLEHILSCEGCDVDPINIIEKATPLHLALKIEQRDLRRYIIESLLDAGADTKIKDRNGETARDIANDLKYKHPEIYDLFRKAEVNNSISNDDIASDDDGPPGVDSGSDE